MNSTTCYCCDNPAVGQGDHVPPKNLFPKGLFSNTTPIIVPSCQEHNQNKSKSDEYLKFILAASAKSTPSDVLASTVRGLVRHVKNDSRNLPNFGIKKTDQEFLIEDSAPIDIKLLNEALDKIARGIYYHHSKGKKKLLDGLIVFPIFIGIHPLANPEKREQLMHIESLTKQDMELYEMLGEFKDLFSYQVFEESGNLVINMKFYATLIVSVVRGNA
ncbi:hypothetical protein CLU88_1608 [Acidovorax sp. 56]|uniref:hypothetical protein n=1 Tax=Acidovorax sp. 56 TaxID=2035205 RepID=UPI000C5825CD|nr:hypothetical protein [Acidovorax sp. 56]PIF26737.1 hypothetical protein CLU88_1608 [Acidovorax sp. 56]